MDMPSFDRISLSDLGEARLQNRIDTKFPVSMEKAQTFLSHIGHYKAVEVDGEILLPYKTLYYDTDDYSLYKTHLRGKAGRIKFRSRVYSTGDMFHETKRKSNKGRTIKKRVSGTMDCFTRIPPFPELNMFKQKLQLKPALNVFYNRLTLAAPDFSERITIDYDLSYSFGEDNHSYPNLVIIELKRGRSDVPTEGARLLRDLRIKATGFSKYCVGLASLNKDLPRHTLNLKMRTIEKLCQGDAA